MQKEGCQRGAGWAREAVRDPICGGKGTKVCSLSCGAMVGALLASKSNFFPQKRHSWCSRSPEELLLWLDLDFVDLLCLGWENKRPGDLQGS